MWNVMNGGMMNGTMNWGMGIIGTLVVIVLVLGAAALAKYVFTR
jgi:hypothetical protein